MSQPVKRNAEEAFAEQDAELRSKRRRRKSRKPTLKNETDDANQEVPAARSIPSEARTKKEVKLEDLNTPSKSMKAEPTSDPTDDIAPATPRSQKKKKMTGKQHQQDDKQQIQDAMSSTTSRSKSITGGGPNTPSNRGKKQEHKKSLAAQSQDSTTDIVAVKDKSLAQKPKAVNQKHAKKAEKTTWTLSPRRGGIFINVDPILTKDNKYLILLTRHDVQIYSTSTSLLVRSINVSDRGDIRTCAISAANGEHLFVGMRNGALIRYDWMTGRRLSQHKIKQGIVHLQSAGIEADCECFFAVVSQGDGDTELLQVTINLKSSERLVNTTLQADFIHDHIVLSEDRLTVVVFGRDTIHVGRSSDQEQPEFAQIHYVWESIATKGRISSCDARITLQSTKSNMQPSVDVAVGLHNGAITVYTGLLSKGKSNSDAAESNTNTGRRLHWHRTAVKALKWSRDGNYLVSGGDESVLVIWQLDTNQKQFLPHLSTSILNITISQSGAHYALRLGDNSVMVLSTADLAPSTNITGLAPLGENASRTAILHPTRPNLLLSAVPIRNIGSKSSSEATHLQSYDVDTNLQFGRQALTRNLVTAVNVAPSGQAIHEPSVTQLAQTSDGNWLATVEEWSPNDTDLKSMRLRQEKDESFQESILRIWSWKQDDNSWIPTIKIENPHPGEKPRILAIAANPARPEIATIAGDGCIRLWAPKTRVRNGLTVKDNEGGVLYNWSCSFTSRIESADLATALQTGALTYSEDGSVLAAYLSSDSTTNHVHLIDSKSGVVVLSQPNLVVGSQIQVRFCGRYLVALSDVLTILDTITLQIAFSLVLSSKYVGQQQPRKRFLAVSTLTNTIAVAASFFEHQKSKTSISVFDLSSSEIGLKAEISISSQVRALLADPTGKGFVIIDSEAGVLRLTSNVADTQSAIVLAPQGNLLLEEQSQQKGIEDIFGKKFRTAPVSETEQKLLLDTQPGSSQTLDELLNRNGQGLNMGVEDLFERVARAVSGVRIAT